MFGCVIPGRLVQTDIQQIDETHAVFHLRDAASINHICVFLLGTVPFPPDYGATLFIYLPGKGFQLLGMYVSFGDSVLIALSNDKPSAIFRLRGTYTASSSAANTLSDAMISTSEDASCMLGISVEPLASVYAQVPPTAPTMAPPPTTQDPAVLAEKVVKHLFNFLSSFSANPAAPLSPDTSVPIGLVSKWYESFMSKLRTTGTAFLDRASD